MRNRPHLEEPLVSLRTIPRFVLVFCALLLICGRLAPAAGGEAPPTRVVIVVSSADAILADLEHMVSGLGANPGGWQGNVFPNIDIFLYGVDRSKPIRFDQVIDAKSGQRTHFMVPLEEGTGLNDFIKDNLDPIGIVAKPVKRGDKTYYQLGTGKPGDVYNGWMRVANDYAYISSQDYDVPAGIAAPDASHKLLLDAGYDLAVQLSNAETTLDQRQASFARFRENTLAGVKKRLNETKEAFALREKNSQQQLETMERLFVESSELTIGWTTETSKNAGDKEGEARKPSEGRGHLALSAVAGTALEATLKAQAVKPGYFQNIKSADNAVLSGRLNFTLDDLLKKQFGETYELSHPVNHQKIDATEGLTETQKAARKEIYDHLFAMLDSGLELGAWDGVVEITPQESGTHHFLFGIRSTDGTKATEIVSLLPDAKQGWKTELDVDSEGEVKIHKLSITEGYPKALQDFFGPSGEFFIGAGPEAVWISGGDNALQVMKDGIKAVATPAEKTDPVIARLDLKLLPVLQVFKGLRDEGVLDLMQKLQANAPEEEPAEEGAAEKPGSETARMLQDFEWREAAIEALKDANDKLHMHLERKEDHLEGTTTTAEGLLKMLGVLIAKFAKENLG
jgi:hypothetical protein